MLLAWRQCEKVLLRILTVLWKRNIWELLPLGTGTRHQVLLNPAAQLHWGTAFSQMPPPFLWKETGNRALSHLHNRTHHICSQSLGQGVARWPCITAREPWEFKLCPQWPCAQKILGGIYECAQSGRVDRGSTRSPTAGHMNRKQWLPLLT